MCVSRKATQNLILGPLFNLILGFSRRESFQKSTQIWLPGTPLRMAFKWKQIPEGEQCLLNPSRFSTIWLNSCCIVGNACSQGGRRQHDTGTVAKSDSDVVAFTEAADVHLVVVLQEFTRLTVLQLNRLSSAPAQLQHWAERVLALSADRSRSQ